MDGRRKCGEQTYESYVRTAKLPKDALSAASGERQILNVGTTVTKIVHLMRDFKFVVRRPRPWCEFEAPLLWWMFGPRFEISPDFCPKLRFPARKTDDPIGQSWREGISTIGRRRRRRRPRRRRAEQSRAANTITRGNRRRFVAVVGGEQWNASALQSMSIRNIWGGLQMKDRVGEGVDWWYRLPRLQWHPWDLGKVSL